MTILVAARLNGKTFIGCDSQVTARGKKLKLTNFSKIVKINNKLLVGFAGTSTAYHILQKYTDSRTAFDVPQTIQECWETTRPFFDDYKNYIESRLTKTIDDGITLIMATDKKIFLVDEFGVEESTKYLAAGCGEDFALGSLYTNYPDENCVHDALEAAVYYSDGCDKPIEVWEIE